MKHYRITVNGQTYDVAVEPIEEGAASPAPAASVPSSAPAPNPAPAAPAPSEPAAGSGGQEVIAPMPGSILDIKANPGDSVKAGDTIVVLEAMKMENDIVAPCDGKVQSILVKKGDTVNANDILARVG